ncbi:MAG: ornithine carbamoyltransferase [Pseudomonadota bacterium]
MKHFLDLDQMPAAELRAILDDAMARKAARAGRPKGAADDERPLEGRVIALVFEKPSTRTRVSFDVGIRQMGGSTLVLSGAELQLGHGETVGDTGRVLSRFVDAIMIRTFAHETLLELAEASTVPVINGLTNRTHPCQIMADVMTFEEHRGPIAGKRIAWFGDGNNVCASWIQGAAAFGYELVISGPETLDPDAEIVAAARAAGATVTLERDPAKAAAGAHALVTDTWVSMHDDPTTRERRHNQLRAYQVNEELLAGATPDAIVMHCLPAHRDEEVSSAVFDGPQSVVFDEAENRLHAQKSILRHVV